MNESLGRSIAQPAIHRPTWLAPLRSWPAAAARALQTQSALVRITMAAIQGSAPREPGVSMLVERDGTHGTIGGGQLEWQALTRARVLLQDSTAAGGLHRVVLGGDIGQCCGGVVDLWIERYTAADIALLIAAHEAACRGPALLISSLGTTGLQRRVVSELGFSPESDALLRTLRQRAAPRLTRGTGTGGQLLERLDDALPALWLYGAGHVGQALARILMDLPVHLTWIDSRAELLPARVPDTVHLIHTTDPVSTVALSPAGTRYIIMTHSHALDYSLCRAVLTRDDFAWAGLIGSGSKAARFRSRLGRHGVEAQLIERLICPIGVRGIDSKWPAAIAVGIATQLLQHIDAHVPGEDRRPIQTPVQSMDKSCSAGDCDNCESGAKTKA